MISPAPRSNARLRRTLLALAVLGACATMGAGSAAGARAQNELKGIDVSNWQREIDWLAVSGTGTSFVFAKATEGVTFTDLTFALNRSGASGLGMRFGAYHFARPSGSSDAAAVADATAEADFFLSVAMPLRGELMPVLDLEDTGGLSVARLSLWTQTWLTHVVARTGVKPIVYVSPYFWKTRLGDSPVVAAAGHRLWIAHWTKDALPILPGASWGGLGWSFWQWSSCQRIPGITGCVDANRFNGSTLDSVIVPSYPSGPPKSVAAPAIVGSPQAGKVLAAVSGSWGGGKPVAFAYEWQRCDAAGRSCSPIAAATSRSYTPKADDVGRAILVRVSAIGVSGTVTASSAPTLAVASSGAVGGTAPQARTLPAIAGGTQAGETLTGSVGTWTGSPTSFSYQWRRCNTTGTVCDAIAGAGDLSYTISPGDIGSVISLTVTAVGKGGAGSATSAPTAIVTPAPVPVPSVGTAVALNGDAGAVTTASGVAVATWQPGALPDQTPVTLVDTASRLALPGSSVRLGFGATAPLPWPIDVQYASAPGDAVPGILPLAGVWQPLAALPTPTLPAEQQAGAYRDAAGRLHVLTRTGGRIALFAPGKWGDPRYATALKPRVAFARAVTVKRGADGSGTLLTRITLDTQAHLYVSITAANGRTLVLRQTGSRIGWWLQGKPVKTLQALQLVPGALPLRLRIPTAQMRVKGPLTLRIVAVDPYKRKSTVKVIYPPRR